MGSSLNGTASDIEDACPSSSLETLGVDDIVPLPNDVDAAAAAEEEEREGLPCEASTRGLRKEGAPLVAPAATTVPTAAVREDTKRGGSSSVTPSSGGARRGVTDSLVDTPAFSIPFSLVEFSSSRMGLTLLSTTRAVSLARAYGEAATFLEDDTTVVVVVVPGGGGPSWCRNEEVLGVVLG